ncbi:MAG: tRNA-dihydrouridine synthase family protein [Lachnospiraceae bacterium]|nr:tRNA-dihydrouridine synthase family protein [Lachnospiraceae bacterium]
MKCYFAPMEGVTTAAFRRVHHRMFPGTDRYYTPFLTITRTHSFTTKERREIDPELNRGIPLAIQLQASDAADFVWAVRYLETLGYTEVNLNLGCPASTAVSRGRGAGMLADPEKLDRFFDASFQELERAGSMMAITVKTRIGLRDPEEAPRLLEVYNRYPIRELIIHPRLRTDYYGGSPRLDIFSDWIRESRHPVCYNGDITTLHAYEELKKKFPELSCVMIGRGLLRDPALVRQIHGGMPLTEQELEAYMKAVLESWIGTGIGAENAIWRMKELWSYLRPVFPDADKGFRKLRKAKRLPEYEEAAAQIFQTEMISAEGIGAAPVRI